jgi:hydroxymethylpyrimidine pyrophosphatase-like HAD family hydrolase
MDKTVDKSVYCRILEIENLNFHETIGDGYNDEKNAECHCGWFSNGNAPNSLKASFHLEVILINDADGVAKFYRKEF